MGDSGLIWAGWDPRFSPSARAGLDGMLDLLAGGWLSAWDASNAAGHVSFS